MPRFPVVASFDHVYCLLCHAKLTPPFQSSGQGVGNGAWRGQCTGQYGCLFISHFDLVSDVYPRAVDN